MIRVGGRIVRPGSVEFGYVEVDGPTILSVTAEPVNLPSAWRPSAWFRESRMRNLGDNGFPEMYAGHTS